MASRDEVTEDKARSPRTRRPGRQAGTAAESRTETTEARAAEPAAGEQPAPSHDEIAARAYELFVARGGEHGREAEDWQQAEEELRNRRR